MLDVEKLLRELNEVLDRHEARIYVFGYEAECWINHKSDDWTTVLVRPDVHGKFEDLS